MCTMRCSINSPPSQVGYSFGNFVCFTTEYWHEQLSTDVNNFTNSTGTRSIFKLSLTGLKADFFSFRLVTIPGLRRQNSLKEFCLLNHFFIAGGRILGFIPFSRVLVLCEMQTFKLWSLCLFPTAINNTKIFHLYLIIFYISTKVLWVYNSIVVPKLFCGTELLSLSIYFYNSNIQQSFTKISLIWHKVRSMGHQVRIKFTNKSQQAKFSDY